VLQVAFSAVLLSILSLCIVLNGFSFSLPAQIAAFVIALLSNGKASLIVFFLNHFMHAQTFYFFSSCAVVAFINLLALK